MVSKQIDVAGICLANDQPFVLFGGLNVLESRDLALSVADHFKQVTTELGLLLIRRIAPQLSRIAVQDWKKG